MRLFTCAGCAAKDAELERLQKNVEWMQKQIDLQNRRLVEIADPRANERVVQADRLDRKPIIAAPRAAPAAPLLPGTEPAPPPDWEVSQGA